MENENGGGGFMELQKHKAIMNSILHVEHDENVKGHKGINCGDESTQL